MSDNASAAGRPPRLTIGMPVWNSASTIAESIECHLSQDFTDFELIVSDNGSDDGTADVAQRYADADPRVVVVRHPVNRGGTANFNDLVAMARGELFKWASGDDLIGPGYLSRCVAALDAAPAAVLAYCGSRIIDDAGRVVRDHDDGLHLPQARAWQRMHDFAARRWLCNPIFGVIRTAALRRTTLLTLEISSDVTVLAELALMGPFVEVPERLFYRRAAPTSAGLGDLDTATIARWFHPTAAAPRVPPKVRVVWDINKAILAADLPAAERARALVAHDWAMGLRLLKIGRRVLVMRRQGVRPRSWIDMREKMLAADEARRRA